MSSKYRGLDHRAQFLQATLVQNLKKLLINKSNQFPMVCSSIDYRNDVKMIKTQEEWFHCKVLYILTSFLWSIRAQTMENCCRFVFFYNNIDRFSHPFPLKFLGKSRAQVREKQIAPPSRHIVTSFPWSVLLSREKSLNYCTIYIYIYIYIYIFPYRTATVCTSLHGSRHQICDT